MYVCNNIWTTQKKIHRTLLQWPQWWVAMINL